MLAWLYWNPRKEVLTLPLIDHPIAWYGVLFALGFLGAFYLFKMIAKKYYSFDPYFSFSDLEQVSLFIAMCQESRHEPVAHAFLYSLPEPLRETIYYCDTSKPIDESLNKSLLFGLNHYLEQQGEFKLQQRKLLEDFFVGCLGKISDKIQLLSDKVFIYGVVGVVVGARLGHILFYENLEYFIKNPLSIFKTWEGGLASHGGLIGLIVMLLVFAKKYHNQFPKITFLRLCDFLALEIPFVAVFIRIGNFFNQEILGKQTTLPWAVIFGSPADGSLAYPRHPAQLYEAVSYFIVFLLMWKLKNSKQILLKSGRLFGIFCILASCIRFGLEFLKENQSVYDGSFLNMGQILTVPFLIFGFFTLFYERLFIKEKYAFKYLKK